MTFNFEFDGKTVATTWPELLKFVTDMADSKTRVEAERDRLTTQQAENIVEINALRERVQRLEKEAEAGKQLNRDLLSCLEAGMREEFDISEMIEAVERYEKIVFPIAIQEGER